MTKRALIMVLDSLGIGGAPDAEAYGDSHANTLGHIATACATGQCDVAGIRQGPLRLPNLVRLGLGQAAVGASGALPAGLEGVASAGAYGHAVEQSCGKDTPSGHWELAGVAVTKEWGYFPNSEPCFPAWLINTLVEQAKLPGILGDCHASGTEIVARLGEQHLKSGKPILYTSADSVLQIAAHENAFGLERLYDLCQLARTLVDPLNIGRVIARPFAGTVANDFERTGNRRDYATPPPAPTLLDRLVEDRGEVIAIGKVGDIFANRGISRRVKANGNSDVFEATVNALAAASDRSLVFSNLVDFDMLYGHRRDIAGYARALEIFDADVPRLIQALNEGDICIITADHGNDPTAPGTDHTREQVPVLLFGPGVQPRSLGRRESFADVGQTVAKHLGLAALEQGRVL